jgi:homoserine acetyltransferase
VLARNGVSVETHEVHSPYGHDSFLLQVQEYLERVQAFVASIGRS